jgi:dTDP-D-glucose 4,6-dehydratase
MLDTSRASREFAFAAKTDWEHGLRRTIEWYLQHRRELGASTAGSLAH